MRIPSGVTDQYIYFVAVDATDLKTRETGLSGFTVRRSRNGGASAAFTTPTINETDSTNMPGVYELLLDEDMTLDAGDQSQEMCLHITHASMHPVTRVFEIYRPSVTAGETLNVSSGALNAISDGLLTAAKFAADFLTAAKIAADVGTEIATAVWASATRVLTAGTNIALAKGTGVTGFNDLSAAQVNAEVDTAIADAALATAANLATVDTVVDAIKAKTDNLPAEPADASVVAGRFDSVDALLAVVDARLDTEIPATLAAVDTEVAAIKAKTDQLAFGVANRVSANITHVNEIEVAGTGAEGDEWGPTA